MDTIATDTSLSLLDLDRLRAAPLSRDPFDFVVVENFVRPQYLAAAVADFPLLGKHGSFPLNGQRHGAAFARLAAELEDEVFAVAEWSAGLGWVTAQGVDGDD